MFSISVNNFYYFGDTVIKIYFRIENGINNI